MDEKEVLSRKSVEDHIKNAYTEIYDSFKFYLISKNYCDLFEKETYKRLEDFYYNNTVEQQPSSNENKISTNLKENRNYGLITQLKSDRELSLKKLSEDLRDYRLTLSGVFNKDLMDSFELKKAYNIKHNKEEYDKLSDDDKIKIDHDAEDFEIYYAYYEGDFNKTWFRNDFITKDYYIAKQNLLKRTNEFNIEFIDNIDNTIGKANTLYVTSEGNCKFFDKDIGIFKDIYSTDILQNYSDRLQYIKNDLSQPNKLKMVSPENNTTIQSLTDSVLVINSLDGYPIYYESQNYYNIAKHIESYGYSAKFDYNVNGNYLSIYGLYSINKNGDLPVYKNFGIRSLNKILDVYSRTLSDVIKVPFFVTKKILTEKSDLGSIQFNYSSSNIASGFYVKQSNNNQLYIPSDTNLSVSRIISFTLHTITVEYSNGLIFVHTLPNHCINYVNNVYISERSSGERYLELETTVDNTNEEYIEKTINGSSTGSLRPFRNLNKEHLPIIRLPQAMKMKPLRWGFDRDLFYINYSNGLRGMFQMNYPIIRYKIDATTIDNNSIKFATHYESYVNNSEYNMNDVFKSLGYTTEDLIINFPSTRQIININFDKSDKSCNMTVTTASKNVVSGLDESIKYNNTIILPTIRYYVADKYNHRISPTSIDNLFNLEVDKINSLGESLPVETDHQNKLLINNVEDIYLKGVIRDTNREKIVFNYSDGTSIEYEDLINGSLIDSLFNSSNYTVTDDTIVKTYYRDVDGTGLKKFIQTFNRKPYEKHVNKISIKKVDDLVIFYRNNDEIFRFYEFSNKFDIDFELTNKLTYENYKDLTIYNKLNNKFIYCENLNKSTLRQHYTNSSNIESNYPFNFGNGFCLVSDNYTVHKNYDKILSDNDLANVEVDKEYVYITNDNTLLTRSNGLFTEVYHNPTCSDNYYKDFLYTHDKPYKLSIENNIANTIKLPEITNLNPVKKYELIIKSNKYLTDIEGTHNKYLIKINDNIVPVKDITKSDIFTTSVIFAPDQSLSANIVIYLYTTKSEIIEAEFWDFSLKETNYTLLNKGIYMTL